MSTTATKSKAAGRTGKGSKSKGAAAKSKGSAAKSKRASANPKTASAKTANKDGGKRLSPGALDGLALEATDYFLAEEQQRTDPAYLSVLKEATKREIAEIWGEG